MAAAEALVAAAEALADIEDACAWDAWSAAHAAYVEADIKYRVEAMDCGVLDASYAPDEVRS